MAIADKSPKRHQAFVLSIHPQELQALFDNVEPIGDRFMKNSSTYSQVLSRDEYIIGEYSTFFGAQK